MPRLSRMSLPNRTPKLSISATFDNLPQSLGNAPAARREQIRDVHRESYNPAGSNPRTHQHEKPSGTSHPTSGRGSQRRRFLWARPRNRGADIGSTECGASFVRRASMRQGAGRMTGARPKSRAQMAVIGATSPWAGYRQESATPESRRVHISGNLLKANPSRKRGFSRTIATRDHDRDAKSSPSRWLCH